MSFNCTLHSTRIVRPFIADVFWLIFFLKLFEFLPDFFGFLHQIFGKEQIQNTVMKMEVWARGRWLRGRRVSLEMSPPAAHRPTAELSSAANPQFGLFETASGWTLHTADQAGCWPVVGQILFLLKRRRWIMLQNRGSRGHFWKHPFKRRNASHLSGIDKVLISELCELFFCYVWFVCLPSPLLPCSTESLVYPWCGSSSAAPSPSQFFNAQAMGFANFYNFISHFPSGS